MSDNLDTLSCLEHNDRAMRLSKFSLHYDPLAGRAALARSRKFPLHFTNRARLLIAIYVAIACLLSGCAGTQRYIDRGNRLYAAGKYEDAMLEYRNAIKKNAQSGEAFYRLGLTQLKLNHGNEAYESLTRAVSLSPQNSDAKKQLAELCLAGYLKDPQRPAIFYTQARTLTDELLSKTPNSPDALRLKGTIALIDNKPDDAVNVFQHALRVSPDSKEVQVDLATAMFKDNHLEEGERLVREAIAKHPQFAPAYNLLYSHYASEHRDSDAIAVLNLWKDNNPNDATPVLRLAAYDYSQHKATDAENLLESLLQKRATIPQADLLVGDFHNAVGNREKALADYQRGQSLDRDRSHEMFYLRGEASTLVALNRPQEALKIIETILAKDAHNQFARTLKLEILARLGGTQNLNAAATLAGDLAKDAPGDARVQMIAGEVFAAKGDLVPATACFQQAAKVNPQLINARLALARIAVLRRNYPSVLENANAALAINPSDTNARLFQVIGLTQSGAYDQAKTQAQQLARDAKTSRPAELQLGIIALRQKNYQEAERHFQKAYREDDPSPEALAGLMNAYIGERQPDRALQLAEAEFKRAPQSSGRAALLAATAQAAGKPGVAVSELQKLATENPNSADLQSRLGDLQRAQGDFADALKAYERARELAPERPGVDALVAAAQADLGQKAEAIASYRKALSRAPDNPLILNNLAVLIVETHGDLNEALRLATAASRKAPNYPDLQDTLAWIHIQRGEADPMIPVLAQLTRKYPANPTYRYHYAVALFRKGDHNSAKQELETALSDRPAKQTESDIRGLLAQIR